MYSQVENNFNRNVPDDSNAECSREVTGLRKECGFLSPLSVYPRLLRDFDFSKTGADREMFDTRFSDAPACNSLQHNILLNSNHSCVERRIHPGRMSVEKLRRVTDYIENHLSEKLNGPQLAAVIHLSVHHFSCLFTARIGISPHKYLLERRVRRAMALLRETDRSIAQIAYDVGFSGQSHFTLHFRRVTGTTPLQFRSVG